MNDVTPTRAALLELQDERRAMREGYEFLDEKRLVLAAEMLREIKRYEEEHAAFETALGEAATALREAVARHGLDGVQVYPAVPLRKVELETKRHALLGVSLYEATLTVEAGKAPLALNPSPEAERCRRVFLALVTRAAPLAVRGANLERLRHEYRRTERRARALEDVLIPEIDEILRALEARLEEIEQEEALRVRSA
jgi:V/A-type H+-transporting ATPase subunit D